MSDRLTIWLKGSGPVRIDTAKWPTVVNDSWTDGLTDCTFSIRKHQDGRMIISGSAKIIGNTPTRVSTLLEKTESADDLLKKATDLASEVNLPREAIQDLIAPLLAVDLD
ncbi:MAG: hypothetical protein OXQ28_03350 [Acidobacteriota bacterium]|nr:hypothetical protein [Acidobacteriota bacterium]